MKYWLIGKATDAGRDWGQEEKGTTEDEMAGWYHWLDGCESEWTPGVGDGQGGLACYDSWGRKELEMTERLIWSYLRSLYSFNFIKSRAIFELSISLDFDFLQKWERPFKMLILLPFSILSVATKTHLLNIWGNYYFWRHVFNFTINTFSTI